MESLGVSTKFNDLANKTQELSKVVAPEIVKGNQEVQKVIKTNLNVTPDAADIPGADNSDKQRELDMDYQKGKTAKVTHIHKVETSNVVFDNVRNLWNEEFSKKDPRQYTGEYYSNK
jgi:hypothetical protein